MSEMAVGEALDEAMKEILERMFFLEAAAIPAGTTPRGGDAVQARLTFAGEPPGSLRVSVPRAAARAMAADFLGVDEAGVSQRQAEDVVCEVANMICGSVLSRLESAVTFHLSAPEIMAGDVAAEEWDTGTRHSAETAIGVFTAILRMESPTCPAAEKPVS